MSLSETSPTLAGSPAADDKPEERMEDRKFDAMALLRDRTFQLILAAFAAVVFCFMPLILRELLGVNILSVVPWQVKFTPGRWTDMEGYYAHGFLIPICAAYLIWEKWELPKSKPVDTRKLAIGVLAVAVLAAGYFVFKGQLGNGLKTVAFGTLAAVVTWDYYAIFKTPLKGIPVKPVWWALVLLVPTLLVALAASSAIMPTALSFLLVATLLLGTLLVAGRAWLEGLFAPILFLFFGLPILDQLIDQMTMPLQLLSSKIAYHTMQFAGLNPYRDTDPTVMYVPNFPNQLAVAAACSGLRTTIAVMAAVVFFMLIARLRWWANLTLILIAVPLSVLVNGFRIALIGFAANTWPDFASNNFTQMHDVSGYVGLALCFVILGWITRRLGYK